MKWRNWLAILLSACVLLSACAMAEGPEIEAVGPDLAVEEVTAELGASSEGMLDAAESPLEPAQVDAPLAEEELSVMAATIAAVDASIFPDEAFCAYVQQSIDTDGDGVLSAAEIAATTEIDIKGRWGIESLRGIGVFTALTRLNCENTGISELDLRANKALAYLNCAGCAGLTKLYVSGLDALWYLDCRRCALASLDLSGSMALKKLNCARNQLTSLDLSGREALESVFCQSNQLTSLNVKGDYYLYCLACQNNRLTKVDVSDSPVIAQYIKEDCRTDTGSYYFDGDSDYSGDGHVYNYYQYQGVMSNWFSEGLTADASVQVVGDKPQIIAAIDKAHFPDATFRAFLTYWCDRNKDGKLSASEVYRTTEIQGFDPGDKLGGREWKSVKTLQGIEIFTRLKELYCSSLEITSLDVSHFPDLEKLYCTGNKIEKLDLSHNPKLSHLNCGSNKLTKLDLSHNPLLVELYCGGNALTELDLRNCPELKKYVKPDACKFEYGNLEYYRTDEYNQQRTVVCCDAGAKIKGGKPVTMKLSLNRTGTQQMTVGGELQLAVTVTPSVEGFGGRVNWSSSDSSKVSVSDGEREGLVHAWGKGTVTITADIGGGITAKVKVKVVAPKPTKVTLDKSGTVKLTAWETLSLKAALTPEDAESKLTWKSSKKQVATVDQNGKVKALKKGNAIITVKTANKKSASVKLVVSAPKPTKVTLNKTGTVKLAVGKKLTLKAGLKPNGAETKLTWTSSKKTVATVSAKGVVKALKTGTTVITVKTANGKKASVKIKVVKK